MTPAILAMLAGVFGDAPVDPDREEARRWLVEELSQQKYQAAKPNWWDLLSKAVLDWLSSLSLGNAGFLQGPFLLLVVLVIAGALVGAFFIFGAPKLARRSAVSGALFGLDESRTSEELRAAAQSAAQQGDWALAIEELFRCLARGLAERVLVSTNPGTTALGFAARAGEVFPDHAARLQSNARSFDRVRYLDGSGSEEEYRALVELERDLSRARPPATTPAPATSSEVPA